MMTALIIYLFSTVFSSKQRNVHSKSKTNKQASKPHSESPKKDTVLMGAKSPINEKEQRAIAYLEAMICKCIIFIDTCELLNVQFPKLLDNMEPFLRKFGKKLMIPSGVETELKNLIIKKPELRQQITGVLLLLKQKQDDGLVEICGENGVTFADQQMLSIATGSLLSDEALFITRDRALSEDILRLNELGSVHGKKVTVNRISKYGYLAKYTPASERKADLTHAKLSV